MGIGIIGVSRGNALSRRPTSVRYTKDDFFERDSVDEKTSKVSSADKDTVFGKSTRYIHDDCTVITGDTVFGATTIYFDNVDMAAESVTLSGDAVFFISDLICPKNMAT